MEMNSFYLSRVLGSKVFTKDREYLGKIQDLGVKNELKNPQIKVIKVKMSKGIINFKWQNVFIKKESGQYIVTMSKIEHINLDDVIFLAQHVLDKQIIDVNGRKVVRVNDIRLLNYGSNVFIIAADIGIEGILRRIGIAKPMVRMGFKLSSKLLLWSNVERIFRSNENIMLSKTYNKLDLFNQSDLKDIIEDFDEKSGMMIFSNLV